MKNTKQVMVRMPPELYERLEAAAETMMTTPSALARILVKLQLDDWQDDENGKPDLADIPLGDLRSRRNPNTSAKKKKRRRN